MPSQFKELKELTVKELNRLENNLVKELSNYEYITGYTTGLELVSKNPDLTLEDFHKSLELRASRYNDIMSGKLVVKSSYPINMENTTGKYLEGEVAGLLAGMKFVKKIDIDNPIVKTQGNTR